MAQDYFQLLELDAELEIARRTTNSYGESLTIFSQRLGGGVASKLETDRAEGALAEVAAAVPDLEQRIRLQENQLKVLLGQGSGSIPRGAPLTAQTVPPSVPAGLPSALLERRPDILQAEQLLRSANAQVGVTTGDFLPKIGLTALFGGVSHGAFRLDRSRLASLVRRRGRQRPAFPGRLSRRAIPPGAGLLGRGQIAIRANRPPGFP